MCPDTLAGVRYLKGTKFFCILLLLLMFFSCEQEKAPQGTLADYEEGVSLAIRGDFTQARERLGRYMTPVEASIMIVADALSGKIDSLTAIHLFEAIDLSNQGESREAIAAINRAIDRASEYGLAYNERGIAYNNIEMPERAVLDFRKVIELMPAYASPYYNIALSYEETGQLRQARAAYQQFVKLAPGEFAEHIEFASWRIEDITEVLSRKRERV